MAIRQTRHVLKNTLFTNQTLPATGVLKGEPLVNLADGILFFSGGTSGSPTWVPSNNATPGYFEVGSNLYDLKIRNKIIAYSGLTNLSGKFLSGTTSGFVLADITNINSFNTLNVGTLSVTGVTSLSGSSYYYQTVNGSNPNEIVNVDYLTAFTQTNDVYVTGATYTSATDNTNNTSFLLDYHGVPLGGPYTLSGKDTYTTGGTYDNNTTLITFRRNDGDNYTVDLSTIDVNDTFVTAYTYTASANTLTLYQTDGEAPLSATITSMSGLTIPSLGTNRVVYTTNTGKLTTESGFEYNQTVNTLTVGNINVQNAFGTNATIGQGGLIVGSGGSLTTPGIGDLTVHGDLTVFGTTTTVATNELYVEDPQITLNYSTGSTTVTSVSSGIRIQDGNGLVNGDTYFTIGQMQNLTGLTPTQVPIVSEYTGLTGYANRGWVTQLNDIVIRNTNKNEGSPNGVRVLAEFDTLDGGTY